ncbi:MAG: hypothetical protein AAF502_20445 [Bacteroidota bacterium]
MEIKNLRLLMLVALALVITSGEVISQKVIIDFNNFGALKAYHSRHTSNISVWDQVENDCQADVPREIIQVYGNIPRQTQADFQTQVEGNVSISNTFFTSYEKPFFEIDAKKSDYKSAFACLTGIMPDDQATFRQDCNYFEEFANFYFFLQQRSEEPYRRLGKDYSFKIVDSKQTLDELYKNPDELGVILNISGGHVLSNSVYLENGLHKSPDFKAMLIENVHRIKGVKPILENTDEFLLVPVFSISLASYFDNALCGSVLPPDGYRQGFSGLVKTHKNSTFDMGMTQLGFDIANELLNDRVGRRVLIDISGMSALARRDYYDLLDTKRNQGLNIPIIASHVGISGQSWSKTRYYDPDHKNKNKNSWLNNWSTNLATEEIHRIFESKGMIGITLDGTYLFGGRVERELSRVILGSAQERKTYLKAILANILTVVNTVNRREAWDIVTIGSNFDNFAPAIRMYSDATELLQLKYDIYEFLEEPEDIFTLFSEEEVRRLMFRYTPEEIVNKLFSDNALAFFHKHLPDTRLATKNLPIDD